MTPLSYFQGRISQNQVVLDKLKGQSLSLSILRLAVFLGTILLIYLFWGNTLAIAISAIAGFASFLFLVSTYSDVKLKRDYHQQIKTLNELEIRCLGGDIESLNKGEEFLASDHHYNQDIDLFGDGSLFQLVNRTGTQSGKQKLAQMLNENSILEIRDKQIAVQELSKKMDWRQHFQVTARLIANEVATHHVVQWIKNYKPVFAKFMAVLPMIYGFISLGIFIAYGFGYVAGFYVALVFFGGLGITGIFLKKINRLYADAGKMKETFAQYSKLLSAVEDESFTASALFAAKNKLMTEGRNASLVLRDLSKSINNLDQRNNVFFGFLANGFLLWDIKYSIQIEKWMKFNETSIEKWFEAISYFDAMNSFGNFTFLKQHYVFPHLEEGDFKLNANELGHPLLKEEKRIDNTINISSGNFFIITGANMAGKSTFLRAVALNIVMANCGLPVCAKSFNYTPIKLISSMRTSDSLQNDESYFFSELKRLKFIVEQIEQDTYFIILDEILKGTNSKDKAEGSQKFVERLVASHSTGLIATHDLSLCTLSDKLPSVQNHYFDAQIVNDELYFDYTFKTGICENMNASFLLKKMNIV